MSNSKQIPQETPAQTRDRCGEHGAEWLGDRIEYAVTGREALRSDAIKIFGEHGFSSVIPERPKAESMLKRASREGKQPKGYITREFVSPNDDTPLAIHVTKVTGKGEGGDDYTCLARVRIGERQDPSTSETVQYAGAAPPEGQSAYPDATARDRARWIAHRTNYLLDHVAGTDLGAGVRKALVEAGAVQSLGGGNNYFAPRDIAERLFALLGELSERLGIYYLRDPKTTLGAAHERAAIAEASKQSFVGQLVEFRQKLEREIEASQNPDSRKRTTYIGRSIAGLRTMGEQLSAYKLLLDEAVLQPLEETKALYEKHFSDLLGGASVEWKADDDPFSFLVPNDEEDEATHALGEIEDFPPSAPHLDDRPTEPSAVSPPADTTLVATFASLSEEEKQEELSDLREALEEADDGDDSGLTLTREQAEDWARTGDLPKEDAAVPDVAVPDDNPFDWVEP